jgi:hypothetical protein
LYATRTTLDEQASHKIEKTLQQNRIAILSTSTAARHVKTPPIKRKRIWKKHFEQWERWDPLRRNLDLHQTETQKHNRF